MEPLAIKTGQTENIDLSPDLSLIQKSFDQIIPPTDPFSTDEHAYFGYFDKPSLPDDERAVLLEFHNLLEHLRKNPKDLLELPIVPRSDKERESLSKSELEFDNQLRDSVGQERYNNSGYEKWFSDRGFDPDLLSRQITPGNFAFMENLPLFSDLKRNISNESWDEKCNPGKIQLKRILELIREDAIKPYYIDSLKIGAFKNMREEAPELLPTQPIRVFTKGASVNEYFGSIGGQHYIGLVTSLWENPYLNPNESSDKLIIRDTQILLHEITHAKQTEIYGNEIIFGLNKPLEKIVLPKHTDSHEQIFNKVRDLDLGKYHDTNKNPSLVHAIIEGEAIFAEIDILDSKLQKSTNPQERRNLEEVKKELLESTLKHDSLDYLGSSQNALNPYRKGVLHFLNPLRREFGTSKLFGILLCVDLNRVAYIKNSSQEEKRVMADPRLVPGLDKNPYISQSLKQRPPHPIQK